MLSFKTSLSIQQAMFKSIPGGTAKFRVQYRTDDNELVAVTADNLTNSAAAYHYLDVQQLSGPTGATQQTSTCW